MLLRRFTLHPTRLDRLVFGISAALIAAIAALTLRFEQQQHAATHVTPFTRASDAPMIAFLSRASGVQNVYAIPAETPAIAAPLTSSAADVTDSAISPDGMRVAYSVEGGRQVQVLDLESGAIAPIACPTICHQPLWRPPGGDVLTYTQAPTADSDTTRTGRLVTLDLGNPEAQARLIFSSPLITGINPQWSANGDRIAIYDPGSESTLLFVYRSFRVIALSAPAGLGALAPDGEQFVYSMPSETGGTTLMKIRALGGKPREVTPFPDDAQPAISDGYMAWRPDSAAFASARSVDGAAAQIALIDISTGSAVMLTNDPAYIHERFAWDPTGGWLAVQRRRAESDQTDLWLLDVSTGTFTLLAEHAAQPQWMNFD